jgi:hypothetical protein
VTQHPILLRMTRLPVGRRASGFVLVAKGFRTGPESVGSHCAVTGVFPSLGLSRRHNPRQFRVVSQFEIGRGPISATTMPTVMIGTCATTSAFGFMTLVGP